MIINDCVSQMYIWYKKYAYPKEMFLAMSYLF